MHPLAKLVIGLLAIFVAFVLYSLTIPEYEIRAREHRDICYKLVVAHERYTCDRLYAEEIAKGIKAAK